MNMLPADSCVLGISERSIYRFNRHGDAPRVASLALFWLTRWGRSSVNAQAINDATQACGYVAALREDTGPCGHTSTGRARSLLDHLIAEAMLGCLVTATLFLVSQLTYALINGGTRTENLLESIPDDS